MKLPRVLDLSGAPERPAAPGVARAVLALLPHMAVDGVRELWLERQLARVVVADTLAALPRLVVLSLCGSPQAVWGGGPIAHARLERLLLASCPQLAEPAPPLELPGLRELNLSGLRSCPLGGNAALPRLELLRMHRVPSDLGFLAACPLVRVLDHGEVQGSVLLPAGLEELRIGPATDAFPLPASLRSLTLHRSACVGDMTLPGALVELRLPFCELERLPPVVPPTLRLLEAGRCGDLSALAAPQLEHLRAGGDAIDMAPPWHTPRLRSARLTATTLLTLCPVPPSLQLLDATGSKRVEGVLDAPGLGTLALTRADWEDLDVVSAPQLRSLKANRSRPPRRLPALPALRVLNLERAQRCPRVAGAAALETLIIDHCDGDIAELPPALPRLQRLSLAGNPGLAPDVLARAIPGLGELRQLNLEGCDALAAAPPLLALPQLRVLGWESTPGLDLRAAVDGAGLVLLETLLARGSGVCASTVDGLRPQLPALQMAAVGELDYSSPDAVLPAEVWGSMWDE